MTNSKSRFLIRVNNVAHRISTPSGPFSIIDNITFSINEGEAVGILGPNGCGKSTLLHILARLETPSSGTIAYAGGEIKVGMVFQHVQQNLVPWRTVLDNTALPAFLAKQNLKQARSQAASALSKMGLEDLAARYPHELSGGQQQLVSIARWLANAPSVLFVDEGWSMLDLVQRERVYDILRQMIVDKKRAICIVSHNIGELAGVVERAFIFTKRPAKVALEVELGKCSTSISRAEKLWEASKSVFNT